MRYSIWMFLACFLAACSSAKSVPQPTPTTTAVTTVTASSLPASLELAASSEPEQEPPAKLDFTGLHRVEAGRQRGDEISHCDFGPNLPIVADLDRLCFRGEWTRIDLGFNNKRITLEGHPFEFFHGEETVVAGKTVSVSEKGPDKFTLFWNLTHEAKEVDKTFDRFQPPAFKGILYGPNEEKAATEFVLQPPTILKDGIYLCTDKGTCELIKVTEDINQTFWVSGDARKLEVYWEYPYRSYKPKYTWGKPKKMANGKLYTPVTFVPPENLKSGDCEIFVTTAPNQYGRWESPANFWFRYKQ